MQLNLAKTAGFCFGVDRAVKLIYQLLDSGEQVATLGPIIHNPQLVEDLLGRGVRIIDDISQAEAQETVVVRTHGIPKDEMDKILEKGGSYCDATCPFVSKIHKIVGRASENGGVVFIAGDARHPEVQGIRSYCKARSMVFQNEAELDQAIHDYPEFTKLPITFVAQTTFSIKEWKKCVKKIKLVYTNATIFDTICNATSERQSEAIRIAQQADAMIVIGGRHSSNTTKLRDVSSVYCKTYLIETAKELKNLDLSGCNYVGVTAGASTPAGIIKEVLQTMSENKETKIEKEVETASEAQTPEVAETAETPVQAATDTAVEANEAAAVEEAPKKSIDEMTFAEALEESFKSYSTDQKVKGVVVGIGPTEIQVDIGRKHAGYVTLEELTNNPNEKTTDLVSIGDTLDLIIMKTNDQEGVVMLSKRRFDAIKGWDEVVKASEDESVLTGVVTDVIRGGVLASTKGVKVFIPASLATASRNEPLEGLLNQEVQFRIIEVNTARRRAVGSIKSVLKEARKEQVEAFWNQAEEGQTYTGTVKSLTSYGAFVDIGGVDGMIHISELSWKRIKHPSEIVNVGDSVEVYVKALDHEKRKISLGYKKVEDNPWEILKRDYPIGTTVTVKIVGMTTFGAFANIIPGIDGLIHISQIANRHINVPQDELTVGQEVDAKITEIDFEKKRVSLSIRALLEDSEDLEENDAE